MATLFEIKARVGGDSYYQVLVVDVEDANTARAAVVAYLDGEGVALLEIDEECTRQVPVPSPQWRSSETPCGRVSASGRVYISRRYAGGDFEEIASVTRQGLSPGVLLRALQLVGKAEKTLAVVMGVAVEGADRVRCGFNRVYVAALDALLTSPEFRRALDNALDRQCVFFVPAKCRAVIVEKGGFLTGLASMGKFLAGCSTCVIEEGDLLCRSDSVPRWRGAIDEALKTKTPAEPPEPRPDPPSPDRE